MSSDVANNLVRVEKQLSNLKVSVEKLLGKRLCVTDLT